jgi:hypothetical protein
MAPKEAPKSAEPKQQKDLRAILEETKKEPGRNPERSLTPSRQIVIKPKDEPSSGSKPRD